jgi:hypothetical protein
MDTFTEHRLRDEAISRAQDRASLRKPARKWPDLERPAAPSPGEPGPLVPPSELPSPDVEPTNS